MCHLKEIYNDKKLGLINLLSSVVKMLKLIKLQKCGLMILIEIKNSSNIMGIKSEFEGLLKIVNYEADADTHKTEGFNSSTSALATTQVFH